MMDEPLDETYFNWLCAKVERNPAPDYVDLFRVLHATPFTWIIDLDRNREADGRELRQIFTTEMRIRKDLVWFREPCSVFEMLIAFADRAWFQTDDISQVQWFWQFLINLNLDQYHRVVGSDLGHIEETLRIFVDRRYNEHGEGGLFPLRNPKHDQRKVELWYQFFEYLDEQGLM